MKNKLLSIILIIVLISTVLVGCKSQTIKSIVQENGSGEKNFEPKIEVYPEPINYNRQKLLDIKEAYEEQRGRYELRGYDISDLDLTQVNFEQFMFDSQTKWPEKLPVGFDIETIINYGKQPGLGIDYLHKEKITGKGVNVGIIDGRLLVDHEEFKDNIKVYEEIFDMDGPVHYHGTPITSILCGKNVGVAPDANIYYIAYLDEDTEFEDGYVHLANAIERMIEINRDLPEDSKIKIVSISSGWDSNSKNAQAIYDAIEKARQENMFIITALLDETHKLYFDGLNREPMSDPQEIDSYDIKYNNSSEEDTIMVPMDARWLASPTGQDEYVMYSRGAWSMAIPYISGLYALACEVNPDITPDIFWDLALSTGDTPDESKQDNKNEGRIIKIVNPKKLISAITSNINK